jgi:hypothetical protein
MTVPRQDSDPGCGTRRALFGWSPPDLPADTAGKRRIDLLLRGPAVLYFALVIALLLVAPELPKRAELLVDGLAALIGSGWCSVNFWRCRHAHCLVTGAGWLGIAAFTGIEAGLGRSVIDGNEQRVLLGILVIGLAFEGVWYLARGTNALIRVSK